MLLLRLQTGRLAPHGLGEGMPSQQFDSAPERRNTQSIKWDKYAGTDILPFWIADMDFVSPPEVIDALHKRLEHGVFGYGTKEPAKITATVLTYLRDSHDVHAAAEDLVWLPGLVSALNMACKASGETGSSVITCTPVYPPFLSAPANSGRTLIDVPLITVGDRLTFDWPALEAALRPDTGIFLLCNPHNPTGICYTQDELEKLCAFCIKHDLILCSDEIHCDLILSPDTKHHSAACFSEEMHSRTITLMAPSKTYNIAGLGFSYAIIRDKKLRQKFCQAGVGFLPDVNVLGGEAAEAAYSQCEPWRQDLISYLRENRDTLYNFAEAHLAPLTIKPMDATYLAWFDARPLGLKENPATFFEKHGVGLSDGAPFGNPGFVRFNFGCTKALMLEGLQRMKTAIASIA